MNFSKIRGQRKMCCPQGPRRRQGGGGKSIGSRSKHLSLCHPGKESRLTLCPGLVLGVESGQWKIVAWEETAIWLRTQNWSPGGHKWVLPHRENPILLSVLPILNCESHVGRDLVCLI